MFSSQHVLDGLNKRFMDYPISEVLKDCVLFFFFLVLLVKFKLIKRCVLLICFCYC